MKGAINSGYHTKHIAWIEFSNPKKRNALSLRMWKNLPQVIQKLKNDKNLRVLIVRGEGDSFSAGGDISEFKAVFATPNSSYDFSKSINKAFNALVHFPRPTIAMIKGGAVGGGCGLALACDIRIASENAYLAVTPAKLGIIYPFSEIKRLVATVGISKAKDMLFSARIIKADEAEKLSMLEHIFPTKELEMKTLEYATLLANNSPNSLMIIKEIISEIENGKIKASPTIDEKINSAFDSKDFRKGYEAFLKKRKPVF
ncbi:MAG: enoyl-CoA hydratase-related protein [Hellea sp.]|nr:enoyl-CoA hydratase-related protein [Hellea sp.]